MNKVITTENSEDDMYENPPYTNVELQTNRYTYNPEVVINLSNFAKIHEYDDRKVFKEAWQKWIEDPEIKKVIMDEVVRLQMNGLEGDVLDKMYKSARYYYRKKTNNISKQTEPRKEYEGLPRTILKSIDDHIYAEINNNIVLCDKLTGTFRSNISAANSFINYCKLHSEVIKELLLPTKDVENVTYRANNLRDEIKVVTDRLKKTYKNRFYKIKVSLKE